MAERTRLRVCVVGSGTRFLSGISYYTHQLACALAGPHQVSVVLMRQLLPTFLYPGRKRVGARLSAMSYPRQIPVRDGADWYWLPSMPRTVAFLLRQRPRILIFQWWTGTVLHSYLLLALVARATGARVVIEFHEGLDTGEHNIPWARAYVRAIAPLLISARPGLRGPLSVRPRGAGGALSPGRAAHRRDPARPVHPVRAPVRAAGAAPRARGGSGKAREEAKEEARERTEEPCNLLYFGVIRPFKGVEDLLAAFEAMPAEEANRYQLTVVGETWEGWSLPAEMIARSRYRERIRFVNRYVSDEEVGAFFARADAVVLPYHRSSASGPLHIAMSHHLPVIVTRVGGLVEAVAGYEGAIHVPPHDPDALRHALTRVRALRGRRFSDPHSWRRTVEEYDALFQALRQPAPRGQGQRALVESEA